MCAENSGQLARHAMQRTTLLRLYIKGKYVQDKVSQSIAHARMHDTHDTQHTVCPISLDPFYIIVSYFLYRPYYTTNSLYQR